MRCRLRMLSHVLSIPFIALHSTHAQLQLKPPQSPLLPCLRNVSFPVNSYSLKRRKFHFALVSLHNLKVSCRYCLCLFVCFFNLKTHVGIVYEA